MSDDRPACNHPQRRPWACGTEDLEPHPIEESVTVADLQLPSRFQAYKLVNGDLLLVSHYGDDSVLIKAEDVGPLMLWLNRSYK